MKNTESRKMKVNLLMNKAFLQAEEDGDTLRKLVADKLAELKKKQATRHKLSESEKQFQVDVFEYLAKRARYGAAIDELLALVQKDPEIAESATQKAVDEFEKLLNDLLTSQEKLEEYLRGNLQPLLNLIQGIE